MIKLTSLAAYALTVPAITLGIGTAFATDPPAGAKDQRTTQEQHMSTERTQQHMKSQGTYLTSVPAKSFRAENLIGADLKTRSGDETIGPVTDLIIDEDGKIAAVIVEVGGFLGMGEKNVAISWDAIERRSNQQDADTSFRVDATKDALENAPEYKSDSRQY